VAFFPVADLYLMPRAGVQVRDWTGSLADDFSESGFSTGLDVGYHLPFGESFSLSPELFLRYSVVEGPDSPSHRGFGIRLMAHWRF
jgi:outer membrane autotransporter protein